MTSEETGRLREIASVFHRLGWITFGGPHAQVAMIHEEVVRRRAWASEAWYSGAVGLMELVPGPKGTKMAIFSGLQRGGPRGALVAGLSFVAPGFLLVLVLSGLYFRYGLVPAFAGFFSGLEPAAAAIVIMAAWKMARGSVRSWTQWLLFALGGALCQFAGAPVLAVVLAGGAASYALEAARGAATLAAALPWPLLVGSGPSTPSGPLLSRWAHLAVGHLKAGALVYGGGYVIIPFLAGDFVHRLKYLTPEEFLAGIAISNATPGPIALMATFIGFKTAGLSGALLATAALLAPCFVLLIALGPRLEAWRARPGTQAFLRGVEAAAVGTVLAAAAGLTSGVLDTWSRAGLLLASLVLLPAANELGVLLWAGAVGAALPVLYRHLGA